jgi:hypothetical protein
MHITDWKSTAWLRALGQKSSSIVDDVEFRPGKVISKNLIGHFDPNNISCYNGAVGGDTYSNLVAGQEDLCLWNMDTVPTFGETPDFESPTSTSVGYFMGDGLDNYMRECGGYAGGFALNVSNDFTLNVWVQVNAVALGKLGGSSCPRYGGYIGVGAINDKSNGGCAVGVVGDDSGNYGRIALFAPSADSPAAYSDRRSIGSKIESNKWYMFSLVKEVLSPNFDRITLYLNGVYQRLITGANCTQTGTGQHKGELIPAGYIGGAQQVVVMALWQEYYGMGSPSPASSANFGHILVYNRALKHSELRQNYLALNQLYYPFREGAIIQ